jgi:hypothetical protein
MDTSFKEQLLGEIQLLKDILEQFYRTEQMPTAC